MDYSLYDDYLIKFNNWDNFKEKITTAIDNGFIDEKDFVSKVGLDYDVYIKLKDSMIYNWIDSISKSVIHSIANIIDDFPKEGQTIFDNVRVQTAMILAMGSGFSGSNIFGSTISVEGLRMIPSHIYFDKIKNLDTSSNDRFLKSGGYSLLTTNKQEIIDKINDVIKYVYAYYFIHDLKAKTNKVKLPKYLYRGIRNFPSKLNINHEKYDDDYIINSAMNAINIVAQLEGKKVSDVLDGKFASFTSSYDVAKLFANGSGYILRVNTVDIKIISSELTEDLFKEKNSITNRYEKEYIVYPKNDAIIKDGDIIISKEEYYFATASPLAINYLSHDDKEVEYDYNHNGVIYKCSAHGYWSSNTKHSISYKVLNITGNINKEFRTWSLGRNEFIKEFGFNPMPTEKTLDKFSNVKVYKINRYSTSNPKVLLNRIEPK